jgi:hypothetical protein
MAVGPPPRQNGAPELGAAAPNPSRGGVELAPSLPTASDVRFEVLDLAGRRVARVADSRMGAGFTALRWEGLADTGHAAPAGMYSARVSIDGRALPTGACFCCADGPSTEPGQLNGSTTMTS